MQDTALVRFLAQLDTLRRHLSVLEYEAVQMAREHGATWEQIGEQLDISRQAARARFSVPRRRRDP